MPRYRSGTTDCGDRPVAHVRLVKPYVPVGSLVIS
jgi:hypothetical protein